LGGRKAGGKKTGNAAKPSEAVVPEAGRMTVVRNIVYRKDENATKGRNKLDIPMSPSMN
jgi:hypothetical protein